MSSSSSVLHSADHYIMLSVVHMTELPLEKIASNHLCHNQAVETSDSPYHRCNVVLHLCCGSKHGKTAPFCQVFIITAADIIVTGFLVVICRLSLPEQCCQDQVLPNFQQNIVKSHSHLMWCHRNCQVCGNRVIWVIGI